MRTCAILFLCVVAMPATASAQDMAMPGLSIIGSFWGLIPLALVVAAVIGALVWKKPNTYEASLDILQKRRHGSEARPGFYERVRDEIHEEQQAGNGG